MAGFPQMHFLASENDNNNHSDLERCFAMNQTRPLARKIISLRYKIVFDDPDALTVNIDHPIWSSPVIQRMFDPDSGFSESRTGIIRFSGIPKGIGEKLIQCVGKSGQWSVVDDNTLLLTLSDRSMIKRKRSITPGN